MCVFVGHSILPDSLRPHGLYPTRLLCPLDSPGKNTGVGCHSLFQGIFPTQGSNPQLPHCSQILDGLNHHVGGKHIPQMVRDVSKALLSSYCDFHPYHHTWPGGGGRVGGGWGWGEGSAQLGPLWALQLSSHRWMGTAMVSASTGLLTGTLVALCLLLLRERGGK